MTRHDELRAALTRGTEWEGKRQAARERDDMPAQYEAERAKDDP
jgi:hypothetical protein